jgi:hypothetical protein
MNHGYVGPHVLLEANDEVIRGIVGIPLREGRGDYKFAEREHA